MSASAAVDFTCIERHPYGVLPAGNILFQKPTQRSQALFPDAETVFQQVLSYVSGETLSEAVQVCRDWYVAGHQPELWRDLMLREYGGHLKEWVGNSWKDTYVSRRARTPSAPHKPICMPVYSEDYYRTHLCRSFRIPPSWIKVGGNVERVAQTLTGSDFRERFEQPNRPVVLVGGAKNWQCMKKWGNVEYLANATQNRFFRTTSGAAPLPGQFSLQAYFQYCKAGLLEEAPLYLFDRTALLDGPLHEDFFPDLQRTCPFWDPSCERNDLFQHLGEAGRPDHTWLIVGPKRSGSAFHMDPNATHAWNAAIRGRKRWIFYPPGVTPPGVFPSKGGDSVVMPISIGEWLLNYYNQQHVFRKESLECTVEPGDIVFVPHGWWHMVINLDDDVNVAITHNYVSQSNLPTVLRFLSLKQDQISGCRDRTESIKPEFIKDAFEEALIQRGLQDMLEKAKHVANQGWPCPAWTDDTDEELGAKSRSKHKNRKRRRETKTLGGLRDNSIMAQAKQCLPSNEPFSFSFL